MEGPLHTTLLARFGRFAVGHFLLSIYTSVVCWGLLLFLAPLLRSDQELSPPVCIVLTAILMGAYFLVGAYTAAQQNWTQPSGWRVRILAILLPALAAWAWEGLIILAMFESAELAIILVPLSFFLAFPSTVFVFFCTLYDLTWPMGCWSFFLVAGLAGLLPPLLFAAGSFWQTWKEDRPHEMNQQRNQVF